MSAHAPGPWTITANSWQHTTIYDADGRAVAHLDLEDWGVTEENQSSLEKEQAEIARLIAALPNMRKALDAAVGYLLNAKIDLETGCTKATAIKTIEGGIKTIRQAISKAEGR